VTNRLAPIATLALPSHKGSFVQHDKSYPQTPTMPIKDFLAWIVYRRKNETVAAIADSLGVVENAVWDWLSGKRKPLPQVRMLAAFIAGKPPDLGPHELLSGLPAPRARFAVRHRKAYKGIPILP
jgi:hypothetical protein